MLLAALIILTLLSFGTILGFFVLQGRLRAWRLAGLERTALGRWSRMSATQKTQALKKIGIFPMQRANVTDVEALDRLFDGALATARAQLRKDGTFDVSALNDELSLALDLPSSADKSRLAHG